jgi:hypothetical protein
MKSSESYEEYLLREKRREESDHRLRVAIFLILYSSGKYTINDLKRVASSEYVETEYSRLTNWWNWLRNRNAAISAIEHINNGIITREDYYKKVPRIY